MENSAGTAIARGTKSRSAEPLFQAYLCRGLARISLGKTHEAVSDLLEAFNILERVRSELEPSLALSFLSRPDLKSHLADLTRGLKQAGKNAEADKVAAWLR